MSNQKQNFAEWVVGAFDGEEYCYTHTGADARIHDELMEFARTYSKEGRLFLYQHREYGKTFYMARRISPKARDFLRYASRLTPTPYNPFASALNAGEDPWARADDE